MYGLRNVKEIQPPTTTADLFLTCLMKTIKLYRWKYSLETPRFLARNMIYRMIIF